MPFARKRPKDINAGDRRFLMGMRLSGIAVLLLLLSLLFYLYRLAAPALERFGVWNFLRGRDWNAVEEIYGALPFLYGTLLSSLLALFFAVPISIGVALFLNDIAPRRLATLLGFLVEMLAAIPSVVYGLWGLFVFVPFMRQYIQPPLLQYFDFLPLFEGAPYGVGLLTASFILAVMIIPTITAISREIFRTVPAVQREGALALGATRWEALRLAVLKPSTIGLFAAGVLGLGRAMGETMAVTMVIGNRPDISTSLLAPAHSMASVLANEYAEATSDLHMSALAGIGLALFLLSFVVNASARLVIWRVGRAWK